MRGGELELSLARSQERRFGSDILWKTEGTHSVARSMEHVIRLAGRPLPGGSGSRLCLVRRTQSGQGQCVRLGRRQVLPFTPASKLILRHPVEWEASTAGAVRERILDRVPLLSDHASREIFFILVETCRRDTSPFRFDLDSLAKPLRPKAGRPLIVTFDRRGATVAIVGERALAATDDERIAAVVTGFGGKAAMSRADHPTGTDRVAVVCCPPRTSQCHRQTLQGDEPEISGHVARPGSRVGRERPRGPDGYSRDLDP